MRSGSHTSNSKRAPHFLERVLVLWTHMALRAPAVIVLLAVISAVGAGAWTYKHLGYKTSRMDLLDPSSNYNRLWIDYIAEFGEDDDAVVVVEGSSRDEVVRVLADLSKELLQDTALFREVLYEVDLSIIRSKGLHYLDTSDLKAIDGFLDDTLPILDGGWANLKVSSLIAGSAGKMVAGVSIKRSKEKDSADNEIQELAHPVLASPTETLERLSESLLGSFSPSQQYSSPWPGMPASLSALGDLSSEHLLAKDGRMGFVLLRMTKETGGFAGSSAATDELRRIIRLVSDRHAGVTIGLTGLPVMEDDEMRASQNSMIWASSLSMAAVIIVIIAGFGGVRHAMMANGVLVIGMAWAFAWATFSVGHLNILSVTFTVTMIGVGIDYGTYYVGRYLELRREGIGCDDALLKTSASVGPGILTGAITTAVAFFTAATTSFTGIAELGLIAGGGILLCAFAELLILPAVIAMIDRGSIGNRIPQPVPVHRWLAPLRRHPRMVSLFALAITMVTASGIRDLKYDRNLLNMQPEGLESVELEKKLLSECDQSVWYALSIADTKEELLDRKRKLELLGSVERVDEIASLLPEDQEQKRPLIERIHKRLTVIPEHPPEIPVDRIEAVRETLVWAQQEAAKRPGGLRSAWHLEQVRDGLQRMPPNECYRSLSNFQQHVAGDLLTRLHSLKAISNPEPPQLSDLPESLVGRFVGQSGRHLLKIYGRGDIWNPESLERFVNDVRSIDPRVTGHPLQAFEASLEMKRSYEHAAFYSLIVILIVLWLDFRNLLHSLLAALPLAVGMAQTFGIMGIVDIPLNPANLIGIPLILGIAVDYGVHIVHDALERPGPYRISPSTANSVLVDALTTILGFGALMIASHKGLESLGRVLTLGVTTCTLTALILLPAILTWMGGLVSNKKENDSDVLAMGEAERDSIDDAIELSASTFSADRSYDAGTCVPVRKLSVTL